MTLGDFLNQAESYRRARPPYPPQLIDQLVTDAHLKPGEHVAEFGAGTGIFTQDLVDRGLIVTAIEPNAAMRQRANQQLGQRHDRSSLRMSFMVGQETRRLMRSITIPANRA